MFAWYRSAKLCIAYLSDVTQSWGDNLADGNPRKSVWFKRGWTLQELIAPKDVWFYDGNWTFLGVRSKLVDEIHGITDIRKEVLYSDGLGKIHSLSVAARMSCKFVICQTSLPHWSKIAVHYYDSVERNWTFTKLIVKFIYFQR